MQVDRSGRHDSPDRHNRHDRHDRHNRHDRHDRSEFIVSPTKPEDLWQLCTIVQIRTSVSKAKDADVWTRQRVQA